MNTNYFPCIALLFTMCSVQTMEQAHCAPDQNKLIFIEIHKSLDCPLRRSIYMMVEEIYLKDSQRKDDVFDIFIRTDIIDSEIFLEKESFNALMRSEKMPSKNARKNVKHILNSFLLVNTYLEAGHLTYDEQNNRFMLNRPVLNTPAPDVCEYYESIASSMNTCMSLIGFKPRK